MRRREYGVKKIDSYPECGGPVGFPSPYNDQEFAVNIFASLSGLKRAVIKTLYVRKCFY